MRKIILGLLLLVSGYVMAQSNYVPYASRNRYIALMADSTFHIPRFNGAPSLRTGGSTNDGALAADTANGRLYMYYNGAFVLMNKDTSNTFLNSLYKKTGTDSVFQIKGGTHTFSFTVGSGSGSTDTTSLSNRINAKADTSRLLVVDTTGATTNQIAYIDRTGGDTIKFRTESTSGGSGAFSVLKWRTGDENAPAAGDSLIIHNSFSGKYGEMYRGSNYGYFLESVVGDTGFTRVNDTTFKVKPAFASNEWYYIRLTDSTSLTQLTLQAPSSHGATTIAYVGGTDGGNNGGSGTTRTFSHTTSGGSDLILLVGFVGDVIAGNDDVVSVTYNGVAMTLANKTDNTSRFQYLYYLLNPPSGAHNVVITNTNSHWILAGASEYSGVQGIDVQTTNKHSGGSPSTLTTSLTTTVDNCWTVLFMGSGSSTSSAGAGATKRVYDSANYWSWYDSGAAISPAGSHSMTTTTATGSLIGHCMIALKPY